MNIKDEILATLSQIESDKAKIESDKALLASEREQIKRERESLEKVLDEANAAVIKAGGIEEIAKKTKELNDLIEASKATATSASEKRLELIKWENKLVEIESRHKQEDEDHAKAREALETEKKTYKEQLKAEFIEALKKQMPQ